MDKTTCTLVALVLCLAMTVSSELVPDVESGGFIVKGEPISIEDVPWQASLSNSNGKYFCGGAIISERFIITSASCLEFKIAQDIKVRYGSIKRDEGGSLRNVTKIIRHEESTRNKPHHDIGLIMLSKPIKFGPKTAAISLYNLPNINKPQNKNDDVIQFTGWAYTSKPGKLSNVLLEAILPYRLESRCLKYHHVNNFCVGNLEEHMASCNGDSGGPAVWMGTLYGIISGGRGIPCHEKEFSTPVTQISDFRAWILKNAV